MKLEKEKTEDEEFPFPSEEEQKKIKKDMDEHHQLMKEESERWERVIKEAKSEMSAELIKAFEEELEESNADSNFQFSKDAYGEKEHPEDHRGFEVWIDQTVNGGYTGDEFAGTTYFKIRKNKYISWDWSL